MLTCLFDPSTEVTSMLTSVCPILRLTSDPGSDPHTLTPVFLSGTIGVTVIVVVELGTAPLD